MSIYNLQDKAISSSFDELIQIDDNNFLRDGTGSLRQELKTTGSFSASTYFGDGSNLTGIAPAVNTGSLLTTASFDDGTRDLTFSKGDSSTFSVNIPGGSIETGSFATTGSNNFIGNQNISGSIELYNVPTEQYSLSFYSSSGEYIKLGWVTGSENKNAYFGIEHPVLGNILEITNFNAFFEVNTQVYHNQGVGFRKRVNIRNIETDTGSGFVAQFDNLVSTIAKSNVILNPQTITDNITIGPDNNAFIVGPVTIDGVINVEGDSELYIHTPPTFIDTGSFATFATTGSNTFNGNQIVSGSIIAKEGLVVESGSAEIGNINEYPNGGVTLGVYGGIVLRSGSGIQTDGAFGPSVPFDSPVDFFNGAGFQNTSINSVKALYLTEQESLPNTEGQYPLTVSGSALYFYDGTNWREVNLT